MDLKIVSGVLVTRGHQEGQVVIDFGSNSIVDGDLEPRNLKKEKIIAPKEPDDMTRWYFNGTPCLTVGLREISASRTIQDDTFGASSLLLIEDVYQIDSTADSQRLTITWKGKDRARIEEITYLAIGVTQPLIGPSG